MLNFWISFISAILGTICAPPCSALRIDQQYLTQAAVTNLNSAIRCSLRADRRCCTEVVGEAIQGLLEGNNNNIREAWSCLCPWYWESTGWPSKPSHLDLREVHQSFTALYSAVPSHGLPIPYITL
jgi:hypothetical protein